MFSTVEPHYNEVLGTMKITLLYQVSHYIRVKKKKKNIQSWDQQNYLVIRGFCYIQPLYNEVPLYFFIQFNIKYMTITISKDKINPGLLEQMAMNSQRNLNEFYFF